MLAILAQAQGAPPPPAGAPIAALFFIFAIIFVALLVWGIIRFFFIRTVVGALKRCQPRFRNMDPGMMWIGMIPIVHIAWNFVIVIQVSQALRREFRSRGWGYRGEDYGYGIGLAMSILHIASIIPYCGGLFGLAGFICWIIYWVKIAGYSAELAGRRADYDDDYDDYEDDEDDRPRRRRRRDRDDDDDDRDERDERKPWDRGR